MNSEVIKPVARDIVVDATVPQVRLAARTHLWLNRMLLGGIAIQFYTVALTAMGVAGFTAHRYLGWSMIAVALLSVFAASVTRMSLGALALPVLALALTVAQPVLASIPRTVFPVICALHGVNAVLLLVLAVRVDKRARALNHQLRSD